MKKYNVTFQRAYIITEHDIVGWSAEFNSIEEAVEERARTIIEDEMDWFSNDSRNFVSATVEKI